jgi:hypothetical protein
VLIDDDSAKWLPLPRKEAKNSRFGYRYKDAHAACAAVCFPFQAPKMKGLKDWSQEKMSRV